MDIRWATRRDLPKIQALDREVWGPGGDEEQTAHFLALSEQLNTPASSLRRRNHGEALGIVQDPRTGQISLRPEVVGLDTADALRTFHGTKTWELLLRTTSVLTAWASNTLTGVVVVLPRKTHGFFVYKVFVSEAFRGSGVGSALMETLARSLDQRQAPAELWVDTRNAAAVRLYQHVGFSIDAQAKTNGVGFHNPNRVLMTRDPRERVQTSEPDLDR